MHTIIKDGKVLNSNIGFLHKTRRAMNEHIHDVLISSIWHAAHHGNTSPLNNLMGALDDGDKRQVLTYVRNVQTAHKPDGKVERDADGKPIASNASFLTYGRRNGFEIVGNKEAREAMVTLCETRLVKPDETYPMFGAVDTVREERKFTLNGLETSLKRLVKQFEDNKASVVAASPKLAETLQRSFDVIVPMMSQTVDADAPIVRSEDMEVISRRYEITPDTQDNNTETTTIEVDPSAGKAAA